MDQSFSQLFDATRTRPAPVGFSNVAPGALVPVKPSSSGITPFRPPPPKAPEIIDAEIISVSRNVARSEPPSLKTPQPTPPPGVRSGARVGGDNWGAAKARAANFASSKIASRFVTGVGTVAAIGTVAEVMEFFAPSVHEWLRGGWRGNQDGRFSVAPDFSVDPGQPGVEYLVEVVTNKGSQKSSSYISGPVSSVGGPPPAAEQEAFGFFGQHQILIRGFGAGNFTSTTWNFAGVVTVLLAVRLIRRDNGQRETNGTRPLTVINLTNKNNVAIEFRNNTQKNINAPVNFFNNIVPIKIDNRSEKKTVTNFYRNPITVWQPTFNYSPIDLDLIVQPVRVIKEPTKIELVPQPIPWPENLTDTETVTRYLLEVLRKIETKECCEETPCSPCPEPTAYPVSYFEQDNGICELRTGVFFALGLEPSNLVEKINATAQKALECCETDRDLIVAIPEYWNRQYGPSGNQLVLTYVPIDRNTGYYPITLPFWNISKEQTKQFNFPNYEKGRWSLIVKFENNRKTIINARTKSGCLALWDLLKVGIDSDKLNNSEIIFTERLGNFLEVEVKIRKIDYWTNESKNHPTWSIDKRDLTDS